MCQFDHSLKPGEGRKIRAVPRKNENVLPSVRIHKP
jgi:hypothetical protein